MYNCTSVDKGGVLRLNFYHFVFLPANRRNAFVYVHSGTGGELNNHVFFTSILFTCSWSGVCTPWLTSSTGGLHVLVIHRRVTRAGHSVGWHLTSRLELQITLTQINMDVKENQQTSLTELLKLWWKVRFNFNETETDIIPVSLYQLWRTLIINRLVSRHKLPYRRLESFNLFHCIKLGENQLLWNDLDRKRRINLIVHKLIYIKK